MKVLLISALMLLYGFSPERGNEFCGIRNQAFLAGEEIQFHVYYSVIGLYVNAGSATFTAQLEKLNNKPVYHLSGVGNSNSRYDWIFKVRDKYESYIDTATLKPLKFTRQVDEGGYKMTENVVFNPEEKTATSAKGVMAVPACVQDVLSAIYYARNIDFSKYQVEDKIPFNMYLDNEVYPLYLKYLGKEDIKTRYGKFHAIKFKPLLVKGTMFSGGEKMTVWVSDDANHLPLRIESPITVGSVKVDMMGYARLRHPLQSQISLR